MSELRKKYIIDRVDEIEKEELLVNSAYVEQKNIQERLIKEIQGLLPEEQKHLVLKLNDASSYQCAIAEYAMYECGLRDHNNI